MAQGDIRIGISGWTYGGWRGVFYPKGLAQKRKLAYAAKKFRAIEINGTFYGLQKPDAFGHWREETPEGFLFAVKGSRYITHMRRLRDIETPLANFLASGVLRLGPKLGPFLWQFPPQMRFSAERFEPFFALLPKDTEEAVVLARRHDARLDNRSWLDPDGHRKLRHAVEIRHESFCTPEFVELLRQHKVAMVCADTVEWPLLMDVTADFVYVRLHGSEQLYASGYDAGTLDVWAKRVRAWSEGRDAPDGKHAGTPARPRKSGRDVFVFFDNDAKVRAPFDAAELERRLA